MELRKNVFSYFVISVYVTVVLYILISGVSALGADKEHPYLQQGIFLVMLLCLWLLLNGIAGLSAGFNIGGRLKSRELFLKYAEAAVVAAVLAAGAFLRAAYIQSMPMKPEADYKTYCEIADLISRGTLLTEGKEYCDYIAMFPHVYGYSYILSIVFRIFGTSVQMAQYFNVVLAMGTIYLAYRTGKTAGGRICGIAALIFTAFWPSQILYSNVLSGDFAFSFILMLCMYLLVKTIKEYPPDTKQPVKGVLLHVVIGILLAVAAAVRPGVLILLAAIVICIFPQKMRLPVKLPAHQPLSLRILGKGWLRCLVMIITFFCVSNFISMRVSYTIDRELTAGINSVGYSRMTELDEESDEDRNQEERNSPSKLFDLYVQKFQALGADDGYENVGIAAIMKQQGTLTAERERFLSEMLDISSLYYLLLAALAGLAGIFLWNSGKGIAYPFVFMMLGTTLMYIFADNRKSYHYPILFFIALLAAYAVKEIYDMNCAKVLASQGNKERCRLETEEDKKKLEFLLQEEEELKKIRKEAMGCRFDMMDALKKGYITVSVSEAYEKKPEQESADVNEEKKDEQKRDGEKA